MGSFDLKTYIYLTITEKAYLEYLELKKKRRTSFESFDLWCLYIKTNIRNPSNIKNEIIYLIMPLIKSLASKFGFNDDVSVGYVMSFYRNEMWGDYITYITAKQERFGAFEKFKTKQL